MDYVYCEGGSNGVTDDILTLTSKYKGFFHFME